MRAAVIWLFSILFIVSACQEHEEVLLQPPSPGSEIVSADTAAVEKQTHPLQDSAGYQYGEYKHMPYRVLFPLHYDTAKSYPLHIFLHGISERGWDNEKQLSVGASYFEADSVRAKYPAFIIFPQCPPAYYWFSETVMDTLKGLVDSFITGNRVDAEQVSIGGFSMGAYGTFAMVAKYPQFFDAAVAISGEGDERKASSMTKPGWQIFAGKKDQVVPSSKSKKIAEALEQAGASVSFVLFENADHHQTWVEAFSEPHFFSGIFHHGELSQSHVDAALPHNGQDESAGTASQ